MMANICFVDGMGKPLYIVGGIGDYGKPITEYRKREQNGTWRIYDGIDLVDCGSHNNLLGSWEKDRRYNIKFNGE